MTGRQLIHSALRTVNAIGHHELPEYGMMESARETLNLLLGSWSAEELMPHHYEPYWADLYAATPGYTINAGDGYDSDSVCKNQMPAASGEQSLTINGTYASGGVATMDVVRHIIITSTADDSARTFTVVGTSMYGDYIEEIFTGPNATTTKGVKQFKTVTSVTVDDDVAGRITVGTDFIINIRRPHNIVYAYIRDSEGTDTPLKVISRERYDEISDKDEVGVPTKLFYDRSIPSGEMYIHPVPEGGAALDVSVGSDEHITNGTFASGETAWTLESQWAVSGGALVRTPGTGDPILSGVELLVNPSFEAQSPWTFQSPTYVQWRGDPNYDVRFKPTISTNNAQQNIGVGLVTQSEEYYCSIIGTGGGGGHETWTLKFNAQTAATGTTPNLSGVVTYDGTSGTAFFIERASDGTMLADAYVSSASAQLVTGYSSVGADTATQSSGDLAVAFTEGSTYRLTFTVTGYAAGTCTPSIGGTDGDAISADGSYSMDIVAGSTGDFVLSASSDFSGTFDDISIFEVTDTTSSSGSAYEICLDLWLPFVAIDEEDIDDEINLPGEYLLALRWNLAAELAPEYGQGTSLYVPYRAKETKDLIKMLNGKIPKTMKRRTPLPIIGEQIAVSQI
jgi:hypothetical protein